MSDADNIICGCSTCCGIDDVNDAYKAKRRKIVATSEVKLDKMKDNTREARETKANFAAALEEYKSQIFMDSGDHRHDRGWNAADQYCCEERAAIYGSHYPDECPDSCQ